MAITDPDNLARVMGYGDCKMSPLKHYSGPLLPGEDQAAVNQRAAEVIAQIQQEVANPPSKSTGIAEVAQAVDKPEADPEPRDYHISTYLTVFPNGTFGVTMQSDSFVAEGNGDHPEEAVLLAMHKLWTQMDRPRCPHCGQVMPEEAGK